MAGRGGPFRFPADIYSTLSVWREKLGYAFDAAIAPLADRDRELEDYVSTHGTQFVTSTTRPLQPGTGQQIYETDTSLLKVWNGSNWVTETNLRMFGAVGNIDGGAPPAIDTGNVAFKLQAGTSVVTTDGGGGAGVTYPVAFPNGVVTVVLCDGDPAVKDDIIMALEIGSASTTLAGFWFTSTSSAGARYGGLTLRVNWIAVGW